MSEFVPDHGDDVLDLVVDEQLRNFSGRQKVVDQNQKLFVRHLSVRHEEDGAQVLQSGLLVQVGKVGLQVWNSVAFS